MPPKRLKLSEKLKKVFVAKEEINPVSSPLVVATEFLHKSPFQRIVSSESPYFSPIKTRNKRNSEAVVKDEPIPGPSTSKVVITNTKPISKKIEASGVCAVKDMEDWEPPNWKIILENIRKMRFKMDAPVDTMGCHKCADENADDKTRRYHCLVSLMLSSQTKDQVNYEAMSRLKADILTPQNIVAMDLEKLENLIKPVSFYRVSR